MNEKQPTLSDESRIKGKLHQAPILCWVKAGVVGRGERLRGFWAFPYRGAMI